MSRAREVTDVLSVLDNLGPAVRAVRVARGLSLRAVGRQSGESAATVMRVERGDDCNMSTARALLVWLGATPTEGDQA